MMKLRMRKGMAMLVALCMLIMMIPASVFASTFAPTDIIGHWAQPEIQSWINGGLIAGYPDGTFKPGQNITRAEFIRLVNVAFDYTEVATISYTDVKADAWYYTEVAKAEAADYIHGYGDGTMKPEAPITREEAATIISQIKELVSNTDVSKYSDAAFISAYSVGFVGAVTAAGIMQGYPDGSFMPKGNITRAESVFGLDKAMDYVAPALAVDSVSAIITTGVDVVLPTVTEAVEGFTIVVKNPAGTVVPVKAINLEVGDAAVTFEFVTPLTSVTVGNWTVGGVTFDTGAQAAVQAVIDATTQLQLLDALQSSYFTGAKSANIATYETLLNVWLGTEEKSSVALIQKNVIDAGNTAGTEAVAVAAVVEATNQFELYTALQNSYFNRVNADFIAEYVTALDTFDTDNTVDEIQAAIDDVNYTQAADAVEAAELTLSRTDLNSASVLVNNLIADVAPAVDKALLQDRIALHSAVIAVNEANTNAKLTAALNTLANLSTDLDLDTVNSALLTNYRALIAAAEVEVKITASDIQGFITNANVAAEATAVTALAGVTTLGTTTAQFTALAQTLSDRSATFDIDTVIPALDGAYITAIAAAKTADLTSVNTALKLQGIITGVNAPQVAVTALTGVIDAPATADTLLAALKATTLTLTNVVDANEAQYLADVALIDAAADGTTPQTAKDSIPALKKVIDASNAVVALNASTSSTAAKDALSAFAIATADTEYINLSSTGKLEVAELVLAGIPYATSVLVTDEIAAQMIVRGDLIVAVNEAGPISGTNTISGMAAALGTLDYTPFENLSGVQKIDVAEAFLNAFPVAGTDTVVQVDYTTLTAIQTAINAAIAAQ